MKYYSEVAPERHLFLLDKQWTRLNDYGMGIFPYEEFLEEAGAEWYYGGNRYLTGDQRNHGLVVMGTTMAVSLILAGHALPK